MTEKMITPMSGDTSETTRPEQVSDTTADQLDSTMNDAETAVVSSGDAIKDDDAVRWPGDLTAGLRADRRMFARFKLTNFYENNGPVDQVVREATRLDRNAAKAPDKDASMKDIRDWNRRRQEYAEDIVPPEYGILRLVDVTRQLIVDGYFYSGNEPHDIRGLYPGTHFLVSFLKACLYGGTEVVVRDSGSRGDSKPKKIRIDYGCMPLYKRDFNKSVRSQVPVDLMMQVYASCELWRAEADGEPYRYILDGREGQGFLAQRDHGPDGPYRRVCEPEGRNNAGDEVMAIVSRYADGVGQQAAVDFYLDLCMLAPHSDIHDADPALVPLGSGWLFDPRIKRGRPMTDDDVFVGCMAGLMWKFNSDGSVVPVRKPLFCEDGEAVYDEAEAASHGGVAFDPERFIADVQPTEDGQNAIWDVIQAVATPRMPRDKAALFVGKPRAGKGALLGAIRGAFGNRAQQARTTTTMNMTQFGDRTFNVVVRGKLLVYSDEEATGGYVLDCAPVKAFISHDPFATRGLYGHMIEITGIGFLIQCMNDFAKFADKGQAMMGRLFVIPFQISHLGSEDRRIKGWMADPRTVNWLFYHALVELPFQSELRENDYTRAAKGEYQLAIDPVREFYESEVKSVVGDFTPNILLYGMFSMWYRRVNGSGRMLSMKKFVSSFEDIVEDDKDFVLPREEDKSDGSRGGFVRLTASKVFNYDQAKDYLHDPTKYCTYRPTYGGGTWEPAELAAWCKGDTKSTRGQLRGWLVRAEAWKIYCETGMTPAEKVAADEERARAEAAKREAEAAAKRAVLVLPPAMPEVPKSHDTDAYYQWYLDSVEIANEEFGGYRLEADGRLRSEPLTRDKWRERGCPVVLLNSAHIVGIDLRPPYGHRREKDDCDAAYDLYARHARRCLERDGAYAIGKSVDKIDPHDDLTVLTRVLDRDAWRLFGGVVERVRRVHVADSSVMWLFGPAMRGSFTKPVLDVSDEAYARYRALADEALAGAGCYAVSPKDSGVIELREVVGKSLWKELGAPSARDGFVSVQGGVAPLLKPTMTPEDLEYMRHRSGGGDHRSGAAAARTADDETAFENFRAAAQAAINDAGGYVVYDGGPEGATLCREVISRDEWAAYGCPAKLEDKRVMLGDGTSWPLIE